MLRLALIGTLIGLCIGQDYPRDSAKEPWIPPTMPPSNCNRDAFASCLETFHEDMDLAVAQGNAMVLNPVVAFCRNFPDIEICMREKLEDCAPEATAMFNAVHEGYIYICDRHSNETQKFVNCSQNPANSQGMETCVKRFWKEQSEVMQSLHNPSLLTSNMCGFVREMEACLEGKAEYYCKAGTLIKGFFNAINKNLPAVICGGSQLSIRPTDKPVRPFMTDRPATKRFRPFMTGRPSRPDMSPAWKPPFDMEHFVPSQSEMFCNKPHLADMCLEPIFESYVMGPPKTVDEICRTAEQVLKCKDTVSGTCSEDAELVWNTLRRMITYTCEEKREEFKDSLRCLWSMATSMENVLMKCVTPQRMDHFNRRSSSEEDSSEEEIMYERNPMCQFFATYDKCLTDAVETHCGRETRDFVEGLIPISMEYTESKLSVQCGEISDRGRYHHKRHHKMMVIGLAAGVPALVILVVLVIILVVVCRRRSASQTKADKVVLVKNDLLHENMKQAMAQTPTEKGKV